ncbi:MAG TPA: hypothetical protein PKI62_14415 [bacterium]|nr:hypothetical protein [bacterium]HPR89404.1 hypothetical protein [bacterium]
MRDIVFISLPGNWLEVKRTRDFLINFVEWPSSIDNTSQDKNQGIKAPPHKLLFIQINIPGLQLLATACRSNFAQ